ncbi:hypothetical protein KC327_g78 [Hortaea werneckii]|nr:hypothetical protein KC327_g78 [Hortaea werneckii]
MVIAQKSLQLRYRACVSLTLDRTIRVIVPDCLAPPQCQLRFLRLWEDFNSIRKFVFENAAHHGILRPPIELLSSQRLTLGVVIPLANS